MLEPNHEHLRFVYNIRAAVVDLSVVPEIYAQWHSAIKKRRSHKQLIVSQLHA